MCLVEPAMNVLVSCQDKRIYLGEHYDGGKRKFFCNKRKIDK